MNKLVKNVPLLWVSILTRFRFNLIECKYKVYEVSGYSRKYPCYKVDRLIITRVFIIIFIHFHI